MIRRDIHIQYLDRCRHLTILIDKSLESSYAQLLCPNWQKKVSLSQVEKLGFGN